MRSAAKLLSTLLALTPLALPSSGRAQLLPLGSELQVNTYVENGQSNPSVAALGSGGFVVVWWSYGSTGSDDSDGSIQGQRYDAAGNPQGSEFQVNSYTTGAQYDPAVAADGVGNFVVVWSSNGNDQSDTSGSTVKGQRYDAGGNPQGTEFQVNSYTTARQYSSDVAAVTTGSFVVVWASDEATADPTSFSVQAQRFDGGGLPQGGQFQVNSYTTDIQFTPAVAADGAGNLVVVWASSGNDASDTDGFTVKGQRYDAAGNAQGAEFQVNSYTTNFQTYPAVAADPAGNFVVVWRSFGSGGSDTGSYSVQGRRFNAAGIAQGVDFQVNSYTTGAQYGPVVGTDGAGNFVVAWASDGSDGSDTSYRSIQGQHYDAAGAPLGSQFQVNSYTTWFQESASVAADAAGNFVVAWTGDGSPGSDQYPQSVQGQRFATARAILGKKILVKDPGSEIQRSIVALGKETATDIGSTILGNPVTDGATLRVIAYGATNSDETYVLDAAGWSATGTGFRYSGPTGGDADPVRKVIVRRTAGGTALLKALVKGNVGFQSLDVVPPDPGDDGGIILTINGGGTYCAAFGAAAGGTEVADSSQLWKIVNASAEGCPVP